MQPSSRTVMQPQIMVNAYLDQEDQNNYEGMSQNCLKKETQMSQRTTTRSQSRVTYCSDAVKSANYGPLEIKSRNPATPESIRIDEEEIKGGLHLTSFACKENQVDGEESKDNLFEGELRADQI